MSNSTWKIKVPGKLMIAGEYAILEPSQHAMVIAIDRYITAEIKCSNNNILFLPQLGLNGIKWRNDGDNPVFNCSDSRLMFIQHAVKTMNQFFREQSMSLGNYQLTINSNLADNEGRKYGLGSSAAIVVAVVTSILSFNHTQLSVEQIFKLSALAHLKAQGNGSGADIAASTFGGWIYYSAFSPNWVLNKLEEGIKISELIKIPWPNLSISPITPPSDIKLSVGWTTEVARTGPMVEKVQELRLTQPNQYNQFLVESSRAVSCIVNGFETGNYEMAMAGISQNRQALRKLGEFADVTIETPKLKKLCDIGDEFGKAKSSGAGGGDCGIAFIHPNHRSRLNYAWIKEGIFPLHLDLSQNGVVVLQVINSI